MTEIKKEFIRKEDVEKQIKRTRGELQREIEGLVGKEEYENFKSFAFKGQMVQISIAFILGAAFKTAVSSLSDNLLMPFLNYFIAKTGEEWRNHTWEPVGGMILNTGALMGAFVDFLVIALTLYLIFAKLLKPFVEKENAKKIQCIEVKNCEYCQSAISWKSARCPNCTSWLGDELEGLQYETRK